MEATHMFLDDQVLDALHDETGALRHEFGEHADRVRAAARVLARRARRKPRIVRPKSRKRMFMVLPGRNSFQPHPPPALNMKRGSSHPPLGHHRTQRTVF